MDTFQNNTYEHFFIDTFISSVLSVFGFIGNCMIVCRLLYMSISYNKCSFYSKTFLMILVTISSIASLLKTFQTYNHSLFYMAQTVLLGFRMFFPFVIVVIILVIVIGIIACLIDIKN